ncbi:hypothetical protein PUN28_003128 [Cardiocondyla obscurior]|uniref:Uncharacterized protein n=1 Tax=Cardiocondyla obscurior TaxID=286306 RepID=A0AAW2GHD1_9HYME
MLRKLFDICRVMSRNSFDIATVIFLTVSRLLQDRPAFAMINTHPPLLRATIIDLRSQTERICVAKLCSDPSKR